MNLPELCIRRPVQATGRLAAPGGTIPEIQDVPRRYGDAVG